MGGEHLQWKGTKRQEKRRNAFVWFNRQGMDVVVGEVEDEISEMATTTAKPEQTTIKRN